MGQINRMFRCRVVYTLFVLAVLMVGNCMVDMDMVYAKSTKTPVNKKVESVVLTPKYDKAKGLYGYVDAKGAWVIPPKYRKAKNFSEGLAAVAIDRQSSHVGYIDSSDKMVIEAKFFEGSEFRNGKAVVSLEQKACVIDKKGSVVVKTPYYLNYFEDKKEYLALIKDKNDGSEGALIGLITNTGEVIKPQFKSLMNNLYGFVVMYKDETTNPDVRETFVLANNKLISFKGRFVSASEGIGLFEYVTTADAESDVLRQSPLLRYGYITAEGKVLDKYKDYMGTEYEFVEARPFSEGIAAVAVNDVDKKPKYYDRWAYLKADGTWLRQTDMNKAGDFKDGVAWIDSMIDGYGYIDKANEWVIEPFELGFKPAKVDAEYESAHYLERLTADEYKFVVEESKKIVNTIVKPSMTDRQKLEAIYGYITAKVRYDHENYGANNIPRASYSLYGALKYNISVCEGYSELLDFLLLLSGVESEILVGTINSSGIGHAWNVVTLEGKTYNVDATWDEGKAKSKWMFYLKDDAFMRENRTW